MISSRTNGLHSLYALTALTVLPICFILFAIVTQEFFGIVLLVQQINFPLYLLGIAVALFISLAYNKRTTPYGPNRTLWVESVQKTNKDILILALVMLGIIFATKDKAISRQFVLAYILFAWGVMLMLNRYIFIAYARMFFRGRNQLNTILIGSYAGTHKLEDWIRHHPPLGFNFIGVVTPELVLQDDIDLPILGDISQLPRIIGQHHVDQVVLLENRNSKSWVGKVIDTCQLEGCRTLIFNPWEEFFDQPMQAVNEGGLTFFTLADEPLQNPINRIVKRLEDILVSLPVVLCLMPLLWLVIKTVSIFQSPGPVFYQQTRTGHGKHTFSILKFRTMHVEKAGPDMENRQATRHDDRVYPFGRFLRRTSLDEIPQFWNVLKGQMSVVGPRPHLMAHDEAFSRYVELYRQRHFVKPGITGLAQERGFRGEIVNADQIRKRVHLDLEYISNWSIWLDLGIIFRTVWQIVFPPRTAY